MKQPITVYEWVNSNNQRPDEDGYYDAKDTTGELTRVIFQDNHWHSKTGHPISMWLKPQNKPAPPVANEDEVWCDLRGDMILGMLPEELKKKYTLTKK